MGTTEKELKQIQKQFAKKYMFDIANDTQNWESIDEQIQEYKNLLEINKKKSTAHNTHYASWLTVCVSSSQISRLRLLSLG